MTMQIAIGGEVEESNSGSTLDGHTESSNNVSRYIDTTNSSI